MQVITTHSNAHLPFTIPMTVTRKGQITIPVSIRETLGIKEGDTIAVALQEKHVTLTPMKTTLAAGYQSIPALRPPLSWKQMRRIAQDEHAEALLHKK